MVGGSSNRAWLGAALAWRLFLAHLHVQRLVKARGCANYYDTLIPTIFLSNSYFHGHTRNIDLAIHAVSGLARGFWPARGATEHSRSGEMLPTYDANLSSMCGSYMQ